MHASLLVELKIIHILKFMERGGASVLCKSGYFSPWENTPPERLTSEFRTQL